MNAHIKILLLGAIATLFYLIAAFILAWGYLEKVQTHKKYIFLTGFVAVSFHAILLHTLIDVGGGQNLSFFNMFSLVTWVIALLVLLASLRKSIENLILCVFPVAVISILLSLDFQQQHIIINTAADPKQLFHVLLAVLTFSVLCIAGLQAFLLAIQERQLRTRLTNNIFKRFPPLETMELWLFQIIWFGFALLSIMLVTSLYFFHNHLTTPLIQKIILTVVAWIIFGILLLGRHYYGWRGRKAIYGTLLGVLLIFVIYFGSILLLGAAI